MADKILVGLVFAGIFIMAGYFAWAVIEMGKPVFKDDSK
jgi:hypothetical protein